MRQVSYDRAELTQSDHRPIISVFEARVKTFDHEELAAQRAKFADNFN